MLKLDKFGNYEFDSILLRRFNKILSASSILRNCIGFLKIKNIEFMLETNYKHDNGIGTFRRYMDGLKLKRIVIFVNIKRIQKTEHTINTVLKHELGHMIDFINFFYRIKKTTKDINIIEMLFTRMNGCELRANEYAERI